MQLNLILKKSTKQDRKVACGKGARSQGLEWIAVFKKAFQIEIAIL